MYNIENENDVWSVTVNVSSLKNCSKPSATHIKVNHFHKYLASSAKLLKLDPSVKLLQDSSNHQPSNKQKRIKVSLHLCIMSPDHDVLIP